MHTHIKMKVKPLHANSHQTKSYKGKTKSNSIISFRQGSNRNQNMLMALNLHPPSKDQNKDRLQHNMTTFRANQMSNKKENPMQAHTGEEGTTR